MTYSGIFEEIDCKKELKRAKEIARKKQIDFRKAMSGAGKNFKRCW